LAIAGGLLLASCSESDDFVEADEDGTAPTDEDSSAASTDDESGDGVADAVALFEDQGFSTELAECAVDALVDQGVSMSELDLVSPDEELSTALALAGAECSEFSDGLPAGAVNLDDPAVRDGFITSFAVSSGLSEAVAECVLDFLIDEGVEGEELLGDPSSGELDPALQQVVNDAVGTCS
ncbi:MAG: hypothetical protein OSA99_17880, partial [Acidimicrobiales bacterium]|nr:hypothetical protein [Acidimicrobiales bacterium]